MATIRSLSFSQKGVLAIAEDADFVHLFNPQTNAFQTIDFFGEIGGVCFDSGGDTLFISCADDTYGGIIEFISSDFIL